MKISIVLVLTSALIQPAAAFDIAGCVTPKAKILANGNLARRFISIYLEPGRRPIYVRIAAPLSLYVVEEKGAWLKVAGSPSSPFKDGQELGWVKRSDVNDQALRNCN